VFFEALESTNSQVLELARTGAPEGALVLAEQQSKGRGRMGRRWESPAGTSLLFSLLLRPPLRPFQAAQVTPCLALAVARAIRSLTDLPAEIKWPNDVLIHGKKVCGILLEMQGQADVLDFVVVGVGVNVLQEPEDFPPELRGLATSLFLESGRPLSRPTLLAEVLREAEDFYRRLLEEGFESLIQDWQKLSCMTGRQVRAKLAGHTLEGMAIGLDPDGALQVRLDNGVVERLVAGDVEFIRPVGA
jgi:BirA family biotin operon repressor/biotin-[acetyl-CoA-carboxylase] ligase